jgi:hypothetical protein
MSIRNRTHNSATDLDKDGKLMGHAIISLAFDPANSMLSYIYGGKNLNLCHFHGRKRILAVPKLYHTYWAPQQHHHNTTLSKKNVHTHDMTQGRLELPTFSVLD